MQRHVVVIGGGLSGSLTLLQLLRGDHGDLRLTLVERAQARVARGIAYQREYQAQVLNVRAGQMSLYADRPDHFVRFVAGTDFRPGGARWTDVVDALRPYVNRIWQSWTRAQKLQFLRHLRPLWEVHRHRVPAQQRAILRALERSGKLKVHAGRLQGVARVDNQFELTLALRKSGAACSLRGHMLVNCIGPETQWRKVSQPLVENLIAHKLVSIDPLAMGLRADAAGHSVAAGESARENFFVIGPVRKGELWETTALREIREQAAAIAGSFKVASRNAA